MPKITGGNTHKDSQDSHSSFWKAGARLGAFGLLVLLLIGSVSAAEVIAWWPMDNTTEATGLYNATDLGGSAGTGILGGARNFTGGNEYGYHLPTFPALNAHDFSYMAWFKPDSTSTLQYIMETNGAGVNEYIISARITTAGNLEVFTLNTVSGSFSTSIDANITPGNWYHLVVVYDLSATEYAIYLDGVEVGTLSHTGSLDVNDELVIGNDRSIINEATRNFKGLIDEVAVFNGTLSMNNISTLYNSGSGINYSTWIGAEEEEPVGSIGSVEVYDTNVDQTYYNGLVSIRATIANYTDPVCEAQFGNGTWISALDNATHCYLADYDPTPQNITPALRVKEGAGGTFNTSTSSTTYTYDATAPSITIPATRTTTLPMYFNFTASDSLSGVSSSLYCLSTSGSCTPDETNQTIGITNKTLIDEDSYAWQGLEVHGDYMYVTDSQTGDVIQKRYLSNQSLVVENADPTSIMGSITFDSYGDLTYYDGYLYVTAGKFSSPFNSYVAKIDPSNLSLVELYNLTANIDRGINAIVRVGDKWYAGDTSYVYAIHKWYVFDENFTYEKVAHTPDNNNVGAQGGVGFENFLISTPHSDNIEIYYVEADDTLTLIENISTGLTDTQGIDYYDGKLYISSRYPAEINSFDLEGSPLAQPVANYTYCVYSEDALGNNDTTCSTTGGYVLQATSEEPSDAEITLVTIEVDQSRVGSGIPISWNVSATGGDSPITWQVAPGDGSANSTSTSGTFSYESAGNYTITATATDADGDTLSNTTVIEVLGPVVFLNSNATLVEDSYTAGSPQDNTNYGSSSNLAYGYGTPKGRVWLKFSFNLSDYTNITNAKLVLNRTDAIIGTERLYISTGPNTWNESTITFNNEPCGTAGVPNASCTNLSTVTDSYTGVNEYDVTSWLEARRAAGDTEGTLVLWTDVNDGIFQSSQSGGFTPTLTFTGQLNTSLTFNVYYEENLSSFTDNVTITFIKRVDENNPVYTEYTIEGGSLSIDDYEIGPYDILYNRSGYVQKWHYLDITGLDNVTVSLYMKNETDGENTSIFVRDGKRDPISGAVVKAQRYYNGTGWVTIDMIETDTAGQADLNLNRGFTYYKFLVQDDDETILTSERTLILQDSYYFNQQSNAGSIDGYETIMRTDSRIKVQEYENGTKYAAATFNQLDGQTKNYTLTVKRRTSSGTAVVTSTSTSSSGGTLTASFPTTAGSYYAELTSNDGLHSIADYESKLSAAKFGAQGPLIGLFVTMSFALLGAFNIVAGLTLGIVGLILSFAMGWLSIGVGSLVSIVIMVLIIMFGGSRR